MKKLTLFIILGSLLSLAACEKSKIEERLEKDTATSQKMGSDPSRIPRVRIAPDSENDKGVEK